MQMSATRVFIFVEGKDTDTFFYSEVLRPVCLAAGLDCDIVRADRVSESGGKQSLLTLFTFLESTDSLVDDSKALKSWCLFCLDKDVDDILNQTVSSPHIVYTPCYTVENLLFIHSDLVRAMAAASSLDRHVLERQIPNKADWAAGKAIAWREYVALCLFAQKYKVHTDCTYKNSSSPIHQGPDDTLCERIRARKIELQGRLGIGAQEMEAKIRGVLRLIDRIYKKTRTTPYSMGSGICRF